LEELDVPPSAAAAAAATTSTSLPASLPRPLLGIKVADFGLSCPFNPLRAQLDVRALGREGQREGGRK